jgi:hypothetical protein
MGSYHCRYRQFPPAYTTDAEGRPLHSWRTLILPYLDQKKLYKQIHLDEPWNSPHNRAVFEKNPLEIYQCPASSSTIKGHTNYVMVIGDNCVSDGPTACGFDDLVNGTSHTIHVVETLQPIHWYQPLDVDLESVLQPESSPLGSNHDDLLNVIFCDLHPSYIEKDFDRDVLRALLEGRVKNEKSHRR